MLKSGIQIRWLNTAGFEMILPGGAHLLVDPWLDSSDIYPISLDEIERADYILLSHIHFDHAQDVGRLLEKFPDARLFVGDLSVDPLCAWQHISLSNIYRVHGGEEYTFDDVNIRVFSGRHTESAKGTYRDSTVKGDPDSLSYWFGFLELMNYCITASDGTRILVWAGMTTPDQKYRLQGLKPDLALMHLSPKQNPYMLADLVRSIGTQVVIPHHHDLVGPLAAKRPELVEQMLSKEAREAYFADGTFNKEAFIGYFRSVLQEKVPYIDMMELEHHKWYKFGLAYEML